MNGELENFYNVWELILSRQPRVIRQVFDSLNEEEQNSVLVHLQRMQSEPGWQPGQRESAQSALEAISGSKEEGSEE